VPTYIATTAALMESLGEGNRAQASPLSASTAEGFSRSGVAKPN
jgi:hypothetical protein